jgi:O-antigen ligase
MIASTVYSVWLYGGRGPGAGQRWGRAGTVIGLLASVGVGGILVFALAFGFGDIFVAAGERFASSGSTQQSFESTSNIARLGEYMRVLPLIFKNPIFGHALGFSFVGVDVTSDVRNPDQWYVHQNYLLVWLKQGLIGLALFVWVLVGALVTGYQGRRVPDPYQAAWCAGASAVALWLLVYCNVHFPLAEVNSTFLVGLIWGGAMAITARGWTRIRWRVPRLAATPPR